jgi:hypothetical protein
VSHYAQFAEQHGIKLLDIATDLDTALTEPSNVPRWLALAKSVRAHFGGQLLLTASAAVVVRSDSTVLTAVWKAVDLIGCDLGSVSLSDAPFAKLAPGQSQYTWTESDERLNVSAAAVTAAWKHSKTLAQLAMLHTSSGGKPIVLLARYQSRPNCIVRPEGEPRLDCSEDCSCWTMCIEMQCQASAYDGLLAAVSPAPDWLGGVFFQGWTSDPSAGGTSDPNYTPHGKPAEAVLHRWFRGTPMADAKPLQSSTRKLAQELQAANEAAAVSAMEAAAAAEQAPLVRPPQLQELMNNTRLAVTDLPSMPGFVSPTPATCLAHCVADATGCGGIVYRTHREPIKVAGCEGMKPTDGGCCYPAPILSDYKVTHHPGFATLGFISAVVRYAPPPPPPPPPPLRSSTLNGYVFGGGEWSYPGYSLDSDESKLSLEAASATGANSVEFTPMVGPTSTHSQLV